jgi:hypothetical protein
VELGARRGNAHGAKRGPALLKHRATSVPLSPSPPVQAMVAIFGLTTATTIRRGNASHGQRTRRSRPRLAYCARLGGVTVSAATNGTLSHRVSRHPREFPKSICRLSPQRRAARHHRVVHRPRAPPTLAARGGTCGLDRRAARSLTLLGRRCRLPIRRPAITPSAC